MLFESTTDQDKCFNCKQILVTCQRDRKRKRERWKAADRWENLASAQRDWHIWHSMQTLRAWWWYRSPLSKWNWIGLNCKYFLHGSRITDGQVSRGTCAREIYPNGHAETEKMWTNTKKHCQCTVDDSWWYAYAYAHAAALKVSQPKTRSMATFLLFLLHHSSAQSSDMCTHSTFTRVSSLTHTPTPEHHLHEAHDEEASSP